jgi:hypothetical protein
MTLRRALFVLPLLAAAPAQAQDCTPHKLPPETKREWGKKIAMDPDIITRVTEKWARLGLPGSGKPIWK